MGGVRGLGELLRAWRDQADPMTGHGRRRAPGLRREELASIAGLSVDYVIRLEQGRATRPSATVLAALADALRLSPEQTEVLYRTAGLGPPSGTIVREVPPSIERLVERLAGQPVGVYSADWWQLGWNDPWVRLFGDPRRRHGLDRNHVWRLFATDGDRVIPADRSLEDFQEALVADLRLAAAEHPNDTELTDLITRLRATGGVFERQWAAGRAARHRSGRMRIAHPRGELTLDSDVLGEAGTGLHVVVYSAPPNTPEATRLAELCNPPRDG